MVSDIILNGNDISVSGDNVTFDRGAEQNSVALNLKNSLGFWHISGPRSFEPNSPLSVFWHNNSNFSGSDETCQNRILTYRLASLILKASAVERIVIIEAIEETGNVLFSTMLDLAKAIELRSGSNFVIVESFTSLLSLVMLLAAIALKLLKFFWMKELRPIASAWLTKCLPDLRLGQTSF